MREIKTSILPTQHEFVQINKPHELDHAAVCVFIALGFFLDDDTYFKDEKCLTPGSINFIDDKNFLVESSNWFEWHYSPHERSFNDVLEEYVTLLEAIVSDQVKDSEVILPLSGGIDSRSQALALSKLKNKVNTFSYAFEGGYPEHKIGESIANLFGFDFQSYSIPKGYLWTCIDQLADINRCLSEFTHSRQMAVFNELSAMNGIMSLGHWGDVLFDKGAPDGLKEDQIMDYLFKKMVKKDGLKLAFELWQHWGQEGDFTHYLKDRLNTALSTIKIDNVSAKVRAFKTTQWAHRWTTTNINIFNEANKVTLPYYDDRMMKFICTVPEKHLADRKLQIAHISTNKQLAKITWHAQKPFNLLNYTYNRSPYNLPYRIWSKTIRSLKAGLGKPLIQRNFELQFMGEKNDRNLRSHLYSPKVLDLVPEALISKYYRNFKGKEYVQYSHSVSMLLTLSLWTKHYWHD